MSPSWTRPRRIARSICSGSIRRTERSDPCTAPKRAGEPRTPSSDAVAVTLHRLSPGVAMTRLAAASCQASDKLGYLLMGQLAGRENTTSRVFKPSLEKCRFQGCGVSANGHKRLLCRSSQSRAEIRRHGVPHLTEPRSPRGSRAWGGTQPPFCAIETTPITNPRPSSPAMARMVGVRSVRVWLPMCL